VESAIDIVTADPKHDLVLVRIQDFHNDKTSALWQTVGGIRVLKLADTTSIMLPFSARIVGYFGQDSFPDHLRSDIVGTGMVTIGPEVVEEFLLSALLLPGHSGSPVLDDSGNVIGVVSSIVPVTVPFNPSQPMHSGLGKAAKVEHLKRILSVNGSNKTNCKLIQQPWAFPRYPP
jgi:S1-C subfamily serine protease